MLAEHPLYGEISRDIKQHGDESHVISCFSDDNQFADELTPLILAAQQNRFEIIMALLMKGACPV